MSKVKTKHRSQINRRTKQYRGGALPLWLDKSLNFIFKETFGILLFWVFYSTIQQPESLLNKIGFLVLMGVLANLAALVISWLLIMLIEKIGKYPLSGITDLNSLSKTFDKRLAEIIKMLLSAIIVATGVLWRYRDDFPETWKFILFYAIVSIASRILAQWLSLVIAKSAFAVLSFLILFGMLITLGLTYLLSQINGGS